MTTLKIVKPEDVERFLRVMAVLAPKLKTASALSSSVAVVMRQQAGIGAIDDALGLGAAAVSALSADPELSHLLEEFEREAVLCLGERRVVGETLIEYFERISGADPVALMTRNGVIAPGITC